MALFNLTAKSKNAKTLNLAGGQAFAVTSELELASMLLTSFAQDQFYRSQNQTFEALKVVMEKCDPQFVAKAAIYARTQFGMRSITHILAAELAKNASGTIWAKSFYDKIVFRPDDMLEIASYFMAQNKGKNLPNAMKKGFAEAFNRFDTYQLAKYRADSKDVKLIDLVNLVRPRPNAKNGEGLKALVAGELRQTDTWEAKLTQAGQIADSDEDKAILKADAWADLLKTNKLGYFALIRNLRNILEQAPEMVDVVVEKLCNEKAIRQSLVLPFRLVVAYKELNANDAATRKIKAALSTAIDISCQNVPTFEDTLVVIDNSGSMGCSMGKSKSTYAETAALFAMMLAKRSNADVMEFGDSARYIKYNLDDSVLKFSANFQSLNQVGHGTNFHAIFEKANKAYKRIVIFSDMQGWQKHYAPTKSFDGYKQRTGANPLVYSIDLAGYGSLQFPENQVFALAGFSDKIFDLMKLLETDRNALINAINTIEL